jgi:pimeloyl-ACP methyl ester carboxylesterase
MLEAMSEFILGMREQFLQADKKAVVVTHDWGALIGARLATEASELADHWVIMSGMIVSRHLRSKTGSCMLTAW